MFDPTDDYLKPPRQGFRLVDGDYAPIDSSDGRPPQPNSLAFTLKEPDKNSVFMIQLAARGCSNRQNG